KRTISYEPYLDNIPSKLNKYFSENNYILMYPEQHAMSMRDISIHPEDINLVPIQEQLENLTRISRAVRKMFNAKEQDKGPGADKHAVRAEPPRVLPFRYPDHPGSR